MDKLIKFGLGVDIDQMCVVKIKEEIESDTELDKSSAEHTSTGNKDKGPQYQIEKFNLKVCVIKVPNLKLKDKGPFKLTPEFLREHMFKDDNQDVYSLSEETIIYWQESSVNSKRDVNIEDKPFTLVPLKQMRKCNLRHSELKPQKCCVIHSRPSKFKGSFQITVHGIAKRQPKYYFRCYIHDCNSKFHSLKEWYFHHLLQHKSPLLCLKCPKQFKKLSAFRVHQNNHVPAKLNCSICGKLFAFPSSVQLPSKSPSCPKLFKCFATGCKKQYKWRQDLHRHVQKHLKKSLGCELCGFVTDEKRLLRQHKIKHKDIFNYTCTPCDFQYKYYEQLKHHRAKFHKD